MTKRIICAQAQGINCKAKQASKKTSLAFMELIRLSRYSQEYFTDYTDSIILIGWWSLPNESFTCQNWGWSSKDTFRIFAQVKYRLPANVLRLRMVFASPWIDYFDPKLWRMQNQTGVTDYSRPKQNNMLAVSGVTHTIHSSFPSTTHTLEKVNVPMPTAHHRSPSLPLPWNSFLPLPLWPLAPAHAPRINKNWQVSSSNSFRNHYLKSSLTQH